MSRILICVSLLAGIAGAQDRQFPAALGAGIPPLGPTFPQHGAPQAAPVAPVPRGPGGGFRSPMYWGGYGWGGYGAYPALYTYPATPAPPVTNVVVLEQAPGPPPPPPPPIRSSIQELNPPPSTDPPAFFAIALKDGTRSSAAAVWVQGNDLRYVDEEGANRRVALAAIDRTATRELNRARHLNLRLPPAQ